MTNRLGLKTLIVGLPVYFYIAHLVITTCLDLASTNDSFSNFAGFTGIFLFLALSTLLISPLNQIVRNIEKQLFGASDKVGMFAVLAVLSALSSGCWTRVEPGYAGIKVNLAGTDKGVDSVPLVEGWVFYSPLASKVIEYPIFVQTATWTHDVNEGTAGVNEEISFNSKENMRISADISLSYKVARNKVPHFYVTYRQENLDIFTHGYMRGVARNSFNEVGGHYGVEEILGPKQEIFLNEIKAKINKHLEHVGVEIEQFGFVGAPRPPQAVIEAINAKIAATQAAQKTENELRTAKAQAEKDVAKAEGDARAAIAKADGEAKSRIVKAEGEAKANLVLTQSINPALLEWRRLSVQEQAVNKWDGKRPTVEAGGGTGMLLQIDAK